MPAGYKEYIKNQIERAKVGEPIFADELAELVVKEFTIDIKQAKGLVNTNLNRLNGSMISNYSRGIYYKPKRTVFGMTPLNPEVIAEQTYIREGNDPIGYETGASFLHKLGLTTQMPKYKFIATNKYRQRGSRVIKEMGVVLRKPYTEVTKENYLYLQIADAIENKGEYLIDATEPSLIINDYINKNHLDYGKLIALAATNYNKVVLYKIAQIAAETRL